MEKKIENEEMRFGDLETEMHLATNIHFFAGFPLSEDASKKIAKVIHKEGTIEVSTSCKSEVIMFSMLDSKLLNIVFSMMFRNDLIFEDAFKIASEKTKELIGILQEIELYDIFRFPIRGEDFIVFPKLEECLSEYGIDILIDEFSQNTEIKELIYRLYLEGTLEAQSRNIALNGLEPELANILLEISVSEMGEEAKELVQQALISIVIENSIEKNKKISSLMEDIENIVTTDIVYNKLLEIYKWRECNFDLINNIRSN